MINNKYLAEFIGTGLLIFVVTGSGIMGYDLSRGNSAIALLINSLATGIALFILITIFINISGAHLYFKTHKTSLNFPQLLDSLAPGVVLAQAIGRIGNYFNQEVFGKPTELPWRLGIDPVNRPNGYEGYSTFHPTFLYELLWCLRVAVLLIKLPGFLKKMTARQGNVFALYILGYTSGGVWVETLRIDEANLILGLRLNIWVSFIVLITATAYLIASKRRGNTKENHLSS